MKPFASLAVLVLFAGVAAAEEPKKEAKFDPAALVGKWTITEGMKMGKKVEGDALKGEVVITKDDISIGSEHKMGYKIVDAAKKPAHIDMEGKEGPAQGTKAEGIVWFDGETLKLAYGTNIPGFEAKRPEKFESTEANKAFYFVMKKAK